MAFTPSKLNSFLFLKLPSAFICGVRVKKISADKCIVTVKHKWINQNPFKSMYFAVQAMAAVMGGCQSLHTNSLDEAYALPSEQAVTLALRTQQVLAYESGITEYPDPFGGSYFLERHNFFDY